MELQALLFDVDGTLADTERDGHRVAFNLAFREAGLDWEWSPELYGELLEVTGGKERIARYLRDHRPEFKASGDLTTFIAELHATKTRHYLELAATGGIPLRPGVERLIQEARAAGLRLAIATTTTPANVTALLSNTLGEDAESWFEVIGAGDVVADKKPAPDIYHWVLREMDLPPEACVVFEDSYNGVVSAHDAGLDAILVTVNAYTARHDFSQATWVVDQLGELQNPIEVLAGAPQELKIIDVEALHALHQQALVASKKT